MSKRNWGYFIERKRNRKGSKWVGWDGFLDTKKEAKGKMALRVLQYPKSTFRIKKRKFSKGLK